MELADLHIFKTVVDEGGIIRAARKLHRVQSSVSTRIRQLEASIGTQLFYRDKQRLTLSPGGETLLVYAEKMLRLSEEARSAVSASPPRGAEISERFRGPERFRGQTTFYGSKWWSVP